MEYIQLILYSMHESCSLLNLLTYYPSICLVSGFTCLLLAIYYGYSKVVAGVLENMKIPKVYKTTALHSLWMGLIHLIISTLCFLKIMTFLHSSVSEISPQPFSPKKLLYAVSANYCKYNSLSLGKSTSEESSTPLEFHEWTSLNTALIYVICAVLIQEIILATRNKMDHVFYSRLLGLIFVTSAVRLRCPILSIQGTFLMSINSSSKEIARALVAWKSYSQEDYDLRPSPVIKFITFLFFVTHLVVWFSLMLFYLPFFIHKLPSITKDDADRFFLAYSYLSILAYTVLEATTSPLWTTVRCLGWCRRSSGTTWRILSLSDCHLLGHYSPIVLELYEIQMVLAERKASFRNKMVEKHFLGVIEGRKRKAGSDLQSRRPPNLLAAVKTVVALKKKIQRRKEDLLSRSDSLEGQQQEGVTPEDSNIEAEGTSEDEEIIALMKSNQDFGNTSKTVLEDRPKATDSEEDKFNFEEEESIEKSLIEATVSRQDTVT